MDIEKKYNLTIDDLPLSNRTYLSLRRNGFYEVQPMINMTIYDFMKLRTMGATCAREIYKIIPYPLHIGITEAGTREMGIIKSSIGIGSLLPCKMKRAICHGAGKRLPEYGSTPVKSSKRSME